MWNPLYAAVTLLENCSILLHVEFLNTITRMTLRHEERIKSNRILNSRISKVANLSRKIKNVDEWFSKVMEFSKIWQRAIFLEKIFLFREGHPGWFDVIEDAVRYCETCVVYKYLPRSQTIFREDGKNYLAFLVFLAYTHRYDALPGVRSMLRNRVITCDICSADSCSGATHCGSPFPHFRLKDEET